MSTRRIVSACCIALIAVAAPATGQVTRTTRKPPSRKALRLPAPSPPPRPGPRPRPASLPEPGETPPRADTRPDDRPYFDESGTGKPARFGPTRLSMKPGLLAEDRLATGETKALELKLKTGEYLHIDVGQQEVDVALALVGPDGNRIVDIDASPDVSDPEQMHLTAATDGVYSLEIRAADPGAAEGAVRVELKQIRVVEGRDLSRISAQSAFIAGSTLVRDADVRVRAQGIFRLLEALKLFKTLGDGPYVTHTLDRLGLYAEPRDALGYLAESLALRRTSGDRGGQASAHERIAELHSELGDHAQALEALSAALALYTELADPAAQARVLHETGEQLVASTDLARALAVFSQAIDLRRGAGDKQGEAASLRRLGSTHLQLGDATRAVAALDASLAPSRESGDAIGEANGLYLLGQAHAALGDHRKAIELYARSTVLQSSSGDRAGEAAALQATGASHAALGDHVAAIETLGRARAIWLELKSTQGEADTLRLLGASYSQRGEWTQAIASFESALTPIRAMGDTRAEAAVLHDIGRSHVAKGDATSALRYLNQALPLRRVTGDKLGEATTLEAMGDSLLLQNNRLVAVDVYFKPALALLREARALDRVAALERRIASLK